MLDISVTEDVSVVPAVKDVMLVHPLNAPFNVVQPTIPKFSTDLTLSLSPVLLK